MISYNPLTILKQNYKGLKSLKELKDGEESKMIVMISTTKKITTKKDKKPMAFVTINDENSDSIEATIFTAAYEKYHELIEVNKIVIVSGHLETRNNKQSLIINEMEEVKYE